MGVTIGLGTSIALAFALLVAIPSALSVGEANPRLFRPSVARSTTAVLNGKYSHPVSRNAEGEKLYEAFSMLHTLSQAYNKSFDTPAVLVVGHQTSGKSALIEALMGFQFNEVGGGTKTRRPIALRMQYNPNCTTPKCYLTVNGAPEQELSLAAIQAHIETENSRLEALNSFDREEIQIRVEYKYCPNMIIIDTPGLIHAPKGAALTIQQEALASAAREAEELVMEKMRCRDYVILCVEDTADWKHATTRNIVMQEDPLLSRTVLVTTKLDTKLPQFSEPRDLQEYLRADIVRALYPQLAGGPFFTSVPAGRVGVDKEYVDTDEFIHSLRMVEDRDDNAVASRLGSSVYNTELQTHIGVSKLRRYLETRIESNYRSSVARIIPLLQSEHEKAQAEIRVIDEELALLENSHSRDAMHAYREDFARKLVDVIHGTARASVLTWGETIETERGNGGHFPVYDAGDAWSSKSRWADVVAREVGNADHKLFGGAQYHRALREFSAAVRHMRPVSVTEDEIANAAGVEDTHDGVNIMRTACVLALDKAQEAFDPMLQVLQSRCEHIMKRLYPVVYSLVGSSDQFTPVDRTRELHHRRMLSSSDSQVVKKIFDKFVEYQISHCLEKCRDDLRGMTRFVTWDISNKGGAEFLSTLRDSPPTSDGVTELYTQLGGDAEGNGRARRQGRVADVALDSSPSFLTASHVETGSVVDWRRGVDDLLKAVVGSLVRRLHLQKRDGAAEALSPLSLYPIATAWDTSTLRRVTPDMQYRQLLSLTEDMLGGRNANRSVAVIRALIQFIVQSWQGQFAKNVVMKFNCFFLLPFIDVFPAHLREEVDRVYSSKEADVLLRRQREAQAVRDELQRSRDALVAESAANVNLQQKFSSLLAILSQQRDISANGTNRVASTRGDYLVSPTHRIYTPLRNPSEKKKRISFHPPSISRKHDVY